MRLQALTPLEVENLYSRLLSGNDGQVRKLSPKTVRNTHIALRKALADAERLGLVVRNAAAAAKPPVPPKPEHRTWSAEQLARFLGTVAGTRLEAAFIVLATTGMRRGEALGLRWSDLDLQSGQLAVVQTITTVNDRLVVSPPKTDRSRRSLSIDPDTVRALKDHQRRQAQERLKAGKVWDTEADLVFANEIGGPIHPSTFSGLFETYVRKAGLPRIRLHDLRHSYATVALKAGIHPKIVSERLGHSTIGITLDLYSHVTQSLYSHVT
jgi:integrase